MVDISIETITPEIAAALLARNFERNRRYMITHLNRLTGAIHRGEWKLNGETIKIGTDGTLIDGQHRLMAVVKADKPITTAVARGVNQDAFMTVDTGKSKNGAVILTQLGYDDTTAMAAAGGLVWRIFNGSVPSSNIRPTSQQLVETVAKFPSLRDNLRIAASHRNAGMPMVKYTLTFR